MQLTLLPASRLLHDVVTTALRLFMALKNKQFVSFCFLTKLRHWFLILPWQWSFHPACFAPCRLESDCRRLDFSLNPLHKEQLCLNGDTADGNICCRQNSKCCTRGLEKKRKTNKRKKRSTEKKNTFASLLLAHFPIWANSSKVSEVREERVASNDSLRSAQLP